ncbi:MAG: transcriptional repressor LexA [Deltaproteobacteria bacterium]|nr:transcriptional repressor LexA [Deltaproteobacteria bacterium]
MRGLTARQEEVLGFIRDSILDRGYPPTLREIGAHMGIRSTNGVNDHLRALERKGYLTRDDMKSRAMRPKEAGPTTQAKKLEGGPGGVARVPVLGRVAAGMPLYAEEHLLETVNVDRSLLPRSGEIFGLRVAGDSMVDAGIVSGDYVFVRRQSTAERGEIVVALIGDEATVKRFFPERDYVRFQPENRGMAPILVRACDFKPPMLLGVVVGVFRRI